MKKSLLILGLAFTLFSCNEKPAGNSDYKTAYIDTQKLVEGYEEVKDLDSRRKVKTEEMGRELDEKAQQLRLDAASFQDEARAKGAQWAQMRGQELQKRERDLGMMQETMIRQLQEEFGVKNDTIISRMKKHIREYGKKHGYDYIYGTGDAASVLYAKEGYEITDEVLKELNDKYNSGKGAESKETKKDTTATK